MEKITIKVCQLGLGRVRGTWTIKISPAMSMSDLYRFLERVSELNDRRTEKYLIAATLQAYDPSKVGYYRYPGRVFESKDPEGVPKFHLDKSDATKMVSECGIVDGAELMYSNGEMD